MTTSNSRKHNSLHYLLTEGGTKATKAFFVKRVKDLRPPGHDQDTWTVEIFLQANMNKILSTRMGRDRKCTIFPTEAQDSFLLKGDLDVFCFLLTDICELENDMLTILHQLRCIYVKLMQVDDAVISDREYEDCLKKLKYIIKRCQAEINDTRLKQEIENILEQTDSGAVPQSHLTTAKQKMKSMRKSVPLYSLEHLQHTNFTDGDKLDIVTEQIRYIEARLDFTSLHAWKKDDVDEKKEKTMDEKYVSTESKHEPAKLQSASSPLMEKL